MARLRVLVTGRSGQLVTSMVERGSLSEIDVISLGRPELDLSRPHDMAEEIRALAPHVVVNAAAYTAVDQAESEPALLHAINVDGAVRVAEAAKSLGVALVQISTDFVFDGCLDRPYREDDRPAPINAYGRSKFESEKRVALINPDHAILRTSWIFSPFGKNFVKTMLALGASRSEISVVSDQIGSPTYAIDLADGILRISCNLVEHPNAEDMRGIFHITGAGAASWADFATAVFAYAGKKRDSHPRVLPIPASAYATAARRPSNSRLDNAKIARIHGVAMPCWRDGLSRCIDRLIP